MVPHSLARSRVVPLSLPPLLPAGDFLRIHNSLLALRQVAKRLEYKQNEERAPLKVIVTTALPVLLQMIVQLLEGAQGATLEAAMIIKLVMKILWSSTQFELPLDLPNATEHLERWVEVRDLPWPLSASLRLSICPSG